MSRFTVTSTAKADINDIWLYIAADNPNAASRLTDKLKMTFQNLAEQPGIGRARLELGYELRSFAMDAYVVFYQPVETGVEIIRVLHGARDIKTLL